MNSAKAKESQKTSSHYFTKKLGICLGFSGFLLVEVLIEKLAKDDRYYQKTFWPIALGGLMAFSINFAFWKLFARNSSLANEFAPVLLWAWIYLAFGLFFSLGKFFGFFLN